MKKQKKNRMAGITILLMIGAFGAAFVFKKRKKIKRQLSMR